MKRIKDKIKEIETYLDELISILPETLQDYLQIKEKAACERYFEKIIEAVIDLTFLIIKEKKLGIPDDETSAFDILLNNSIISKNLNKKLKQAKGMRNILAHKYGSIDDELVFHSITEELEKDIDKFIKQIKATS